MTVQKTQFTFRTVLAEIDGLLVKTVVFLPDDVIRKLPGGRVRVKGTLNGADFALAAQNRKDGSRYFSVSASLRKAGKMKIGSPVDVAFRIIDPDELEVPEELDAVLRQDGDASAAWEKLTTGYRRSLIHYVTSVKNVDSRIKRSIELLEKAKRGLLHGQKKERR